MTGQKCQSFDLGLSPLLRLNERPDHFSASLHIDIAIWDLIEALTVAILNGLISFVALSLLGQTALSYLTGVDTVAIHPRNASFLEAGSSIHDSKYRHYTIKFCHRLFFGVLAGMISFVVSFLSLILGLSFYPSSCLASVISSLVVLASLRFSGMCPQSRPFHFFGKLCLTLFKCSISDPYAAY